MKVFSEVCYKTHHKNIFNKRLPTPQLGKIQYEVI